MRKETWLRTDDACDLLCVDRTIFAEIRRHVPDFPTRRSEENASGGALEWPGCNLNLMKRLHDEGIPWLIAARVSIIGKFTRGTFVIDRRAI
jgi:hypothetical protein